MKRVLLGLLPACVLLTACPSPNVNQNVQVTLDQKLIDGLLKPSANPTASSPPTPDTPAAPPANSGSIDAEANADIEQVIYDNANALNTQDVNAFYNTLHPASEFATYMPDIFYALLQYQTRYNIRSQQVQSVSGNSASVLVSRRTSDISGTIDQEILYTMQQSNGVWKVYFMTDQSNVRN
ncbi:MAG: hypothetical protein ACO1RX_06975 [Candidatus Sericytochromatia bacterium]